MNLHNKFFLFNFQVTNDDESNQVYLQAHDPGFVWLVQQAKFGPLVNESSPDNLFNREAMAFFGPWDLPL